MEVSQTMKNSNLPQRGNLQESLSVQPLTAERPSVRHLNLGLYLDRVARIACINRQVRYEKLTPVQRLHVSHFRCHHCGLVPLYSLNLTHRTRPRCAKCNNTVTFTSSGKYGRIRKEIALRIKSERHEIDSLLRD